MRSYLWDNPASNAGINGCYSRFRGIFRILSLAVSIVFLVEQTALAQDPSSVQVSSKASSSASASIDLRQFSIPRNIGIAKDVRVYGSDEVIINIKDAHDNLSAQESIVDILDNLVVNYELRLIAVEGSSGFIDTSIISSFPDSEVKKKLADELMAEGRVSAAEYFSAIKDPGIALYGIDDAAMHAKNMEAFRKVLGDREENYRKAKALYNALTGLEKHLYSEDLRLLEANSIVNGSGNARFTERWEKIREIGEDNGVHPGDYENINNLLKAVEMEKKCDFGNTDIEREELLKKLRVSLPKNKLEELVLKSLSFKLGKISASMYYSHLLDLARLEGMGLSAYPNMIRYVDYMALYESVDIGAIKDEVVEYESRIREKLIKNEHDRKLSDLMRKAGVLCDLFEVKLTSKSLDYFQKNRSSFTPGEFTSFLAEMYRKYGMSLPADLDVAGIFGVIRPAEDFYELTLKRNDAMVANTISLMRAEGQNVAALITGGFHSKGITEIFRDMKVSHLIILPKFDKNRKRPYIAIITNSKDKYDDIVKDGEYHIALETLFNNPVFDRECMEKLIRMYMGLRGLSEAEMRSVVYKYRTQY
ncbi:MAG: hypothetical protein ABH885_01195, partial [Candidatus Omnitrophota bacterium]